MSDYEDVIRQMDSDSAASPAAASAPAAPENPYLGVVQSMAADTQRAATDTLLGAQASKPDAAARAMQLAPQVGVPAPAVEADLPTYEQQAQLQRNRATMQQNPVLAQWVAANPMAARVAQDDFDKLDVISKLTTALKTGVSGALAQNELGRLYSDKALGQLTGAPSQSNAAIAGAESDAAKASQLQLRGIYGGVQQIAGFGAGMLDNFLHASTQAYQGAAAGAAIGAVAGSAAGGVGAAPGAAAGALSGAGIGFGLGWKEDMARVQYGLTYRALDQMHDAQGNAMSEPAKQIGAALAGALTFGIAQAGGQVTGAALRPALQPFIADAVTQAMARPTVQLAARNFAIAAAKGGVEGAALNAGMEEASIAGEELAKQISPGQFNTVFNDEATRQAAITRLADAAESGALLFGGMHLAGASLGLAGDMLRVRQAQEDMQTFQGLQDGAAASATRDRNLAAFQSFMQSQVDGTPVENLYVPAERVAQLYQAHGVEPGDNDPLFGFVPDMKQQLEQAQPLGGDVVIPTADYVTHMAGTDVSRALLPDIRVRQDGMSLNDAQRFFQSSDFNLRRDAQALAGMEDPVKQIFDDVSRQALESGYSEGAAQKYATLFASRYAARGARLGVDPMELYRQSGVEIQRAEGGELPPDSLQQQPAPEEEGKTGPFGPIFDQFKGDVAGAIAHLKGQKTGEATAALNHPDVGDIDLVWGKEGTNKSDGYGLAKLLKFHPEVVDDLQNIVSSMQVASRSDNRVNLESPDHRAAVRLTWDGVAKKWLVTAFEKRKGGGTDTRADTAGAKGLGDTARQATPETIVDQDLKKFYQERDAENARGSITFATGRSVINLFRGSDMSTLLHEAGHLWLEEMRADATRLDAPAQLRDDMAAIAKWMGVSDPSEIKVEHHEQFARAAEVYFMEGKAPSGALASAFRAFKAWLTTIYRNVAALNVPMNDEIRGIFDRMLATDDELQNAQRQQGLRANFGDAASAGMTDREFSEYQRTLAGASADADASLLSKVMEHVRKRRTSDYEAYRERVKAEVTADADARPDVHALTSLRAGAIDDGSGGSVKIGKLRAAAVDEAYGPGTAERMPKGTTTKRGGVHPDDMADVLGFSSGQELVQQLLALEQQERDIRQTPGERRTARQYIIDRRTDFRMSEEQPDVLTDGSIRDAAIEAIHNQEMQKALQIELRALGRRIHQDAFSAKDAREWARDQVDGKTVRDVQASGKYSRAEAKAARMVEQALLDGDHAAAFKYKQQQVLNHHLFVAAREAAEEIQSASKELNRYANKRTIPGLSQEYLDQIHGILDRFDFGDASQREVARRASLREWATRQIDNGAELNVAPELLSSAFSKHFSELTVSEFRGIRDTVENIAHLGKLKQTLLDGADQRNFDDVVAEAVAATEQLKEKSQPLERNPGVGGRGIDAINAKWLNLKSNLRSLDASMLKMEQVFDWLDRHDSNGIFNRVVFRRLADAGVREADMRGRAVKRLRELHEALPKEVTRGWLNRYELPELVDSKTGQPSRLLKKDIVAMALNTGNDSNFEKMVRGEGWSRQAVQAVLNRHMTKADWDFVQGSWDLIESYWPDIEAMEKRLSGIAPDKVRPTEVSTPFGRYRGGYYPMVYDPLRARDVELNRQRSSDKMFDRNNYVRATTDKGHTIERIQDYSRPVYLSLDVLPRHLVGMMHDLAYREAIIDADRFLSDERVADAVEKVMGREIYQQFRPWLQSIANDKAYDARGLAWWDRMAHVARVNTTMVGLGFRISTMMVHGSTALFNSIGEIGPRWMLSGIHAFDTPAKWAAAKQFVYDRSGEMRNRMNEIDRDVRDALREMEVQGNRNPVQKGADVARRFAFYGVAMLDMGSAMPTWVGAYNKAMHEGMSEEDAVYSADKAVRNAHGGGGVKDLAAVQRPKSEYMKLTTMFYSFWNHFYNRQRDIERRAGSGIDNLRAGDYRAAADDFGMVLARSFFYFVIPQLIHAWLKPAPSSQSNDDQSWAAWAAEEVGLGMVSGIPVFRDLANSAMTGRDYAATPAAQLVTSLFATGKDVAAATGLSDREVSDKWLKHAIQTPGYVFGLPTGQASSTAQFLWDVHNGDQSPQDVHEFLHGLIYGKTQ